MKTTLNDFIKKPREVKEKSGPQTKFWNKSWVASVAPGYGEGKNKAQTKMNPFKAGRQ